MSAVCDMSEDLSIVLPMRAGSQRVPKKNTKPFAGYRYGLADLKIRQLLGVPGVSEIIVDTDEPLIVDIVDSLGLSKQERSKIRVEPRDPNFSGSDITTDSLIRYLANKLETKDVLWTHVTSPFINASVYVDAIQSYFERDRAQYDSLMSVTVLQEFIWDDQGPCNYDVKVERWPRTQTLPKWHFVNSGMFICDSSFYRDKGDRIGSKPFLFEIDKIIGFDVDWPIDFEVAEYIAIQRPELIRF